MQDNPPQHHPAEEEENSVIGQEPSKEPHGVAAEANGPGPTESSVETVIVREDTPVVGDVDDGSAELVVAKSPGQEQHPESPHVSEPGPPQDLSAISAFLGVGPSLLQTVNGGILRKIEARITELSDLRSEKVLLEVSLEQATHLTNKKADIFKSQLTKLQTSNKELSEVNATLESSKNHLQEKLIDLEAKYLSSASSSGLTQSRIDELIEEKRQTLALVEKKSKDVDALKAEYSELQDSNSELRKRLVEIETSSQTFQSNLTHERMKVHSLETQLELVNKNHEWLNNELQKNTNDFSQYRRDKSIELSSLQSEVDKQRSELNTLALRYQNASSRAEDVTKKLDDSLVQVKILNDAKAANEEEFVREMSVKDRLVNLLQKSNEDNKLKISQLESRLANSRSDVAGESAVLQSTLDDYKHQLHESEKRIEHLEQTIDELSQTSHADVSSSLISIPPLSPSAKAVAMSHGGLSLSQLYADFTLIKRQLTQERRAKERMQQQMDAFVTELEQKAPIINATKERAALLENELTELSMILETTSREKDELQRSRSDLHIRFEESQQQIGILNKQRVDLARQVQHLLVQVTIRNDSGGPFTPAEHQALERIAKGDRVINESDTDKLISQRLVTFQNIVDLQKKNEELLRIIRELGSKLEQQEQTSRSKLEDLESVAINEAKEAILTLQEELNTYEGKLNAVSRERDMFRSLMANKGASNNILGAELTHGHSDEISELTKKYSALEKELDHTTQQLKQIKVESETMINILNQQVSSLSGERSELAVNLAREKSSNTLVEERYKSLQDNFKYAKSEIEELRQSAQFLQDSLAKQDVRTLRVAEELVQAKSLVESLRSESSNLRAEKQLWKSIEKRLSDENSSLAEEKAKLNALLMNLQSIDKERELSTAESQKRLLVQSESLERELVTVRTKLSESQNEFKEVLQRKGADTQAFQDRIDTLRTELSTTRETLIAKNGAVDQLTHKVDSLSAKLASAEARVKDYQSLTDGSSSQSTIVTESLKLRSELDDARAELETSNAAVDEFKQIANAAEEALNSMNSSFDSYKESTSTEIEKLLSENKSLTERAAILNDQVETVNSELSLQRSEAQKEIDLANKEADHLRSQISDATKLKEDYDAKVALIESSYQQQVEIAAEAQQNYSKELQKHAEASKAFSALREETNAFKQQISELSASAKRAQEQLTKSEQSWEIQKAQFEEEISVNAVRVQDLASQNHILYNEIEKLTRRKESADAGEAVSFDGSSEELRELINLLRHEKDISDTQLDVASRDLKRARQQLDLVTAELDKTRLELVKSQNRDSDVNRLSREHDELLQELQQLNLLRESNTTLRSELHSNIDRVKELEAKLADVAAKFQPLESTNAELQAEIAHRVQELKLVGEERDRWRQKSLDIINKYDRVDPEDYVKLKEEVVALTQKNQEITQTLAERNAAMVELDAKFDRVRKQAVERLRAKDVIIKTANDQAAAVQKQLDELSRAPNEEIEALRETIKELESGVNTARADDGELSAVKNELTTVKADLMEKTVAAARVSELETTLKNSEVEKSGLTKQIGDLEADIAKVKEELSSKASAVSEAAAPAALEKAELEESIEKLKAEILDLETAKSNLQAVVGQLENHETSEDTSKSVDEALKEQEATLRSKFEEESKTKIAEALEALKARIRQPSEARLQQLADMKAKKFEDEYNKKVETLKADFDKKILGMKKEGNNRDHDGHEAKVKADYEATIAQLTKDFQAQKAAALEQGRKLGREDTLKETKMRTKLLQNKLDKIVAENKELKVKQEKPAVETSVEAPAVATREVPVETIASTAEAATAEAGLKRPAEGGDEPAEKKSKSDS